MTITQPICALFSFSDYSGLIILFIIVSVGLAFLRSEIKESNSQSYKSNETDYLNIKTSLTKPNRTQNTPSAKKIHKAAPYPIIHKQSIFKDNMNYNYYSVKALYLQTKRKRTVKVEAFDENEVKEQLLLTGFSEPFEITQIPFPEPTEEQIAACRAHGSILPADACQFDASAIISKEIARDSIPNPDLLHFATAKKIKLSYYIGKKALYDVIFYTLENEDKIAFFIFAIYRFTSNDRQANLDSSPHRDIFYEFANSKISDLSFVRSMNKYHGSELRYFGKINVDGYEYTGGSKNTIAYKDSLTFLKEKNLV